MHNRYFKSNKAITPEIESVMVGDIRSQRPRSKNGNVIIKLHLDDHSDYPFLEGWEEFTHEEMLEDIKGDEWISNIFINPIK